MRVKYSRLAPLQPALKSNRQARVGVEEAGPQRGVSEVDYGGAGRRRPADGFDASQPSAPAVVT